MRKRDYLMPAKNDHILKPIGKFTRHILLIANIFVAILLILGAAAWYIAPSKFILPSYIGLGFPVVIIINIIFLTIWLISRKWKYAIALSILFVILYAPISAYFPINITGQSVPDNSIKILTYNVSNFNWKTGKEARNNPLIEYIANSGADIVCMQEFFIAKNKNKQSIISESELNKIMKDYPYRSITPLSANKGAKNNFGLAIYSKYPIKKSKEIPLKSAYNGAAYYELDINGKKISLFNNHLESNKITPEDKALYKKFIKTDEKGEMADKVAQNIHRRLSKAYKIREQQVKIISDYIQKQDSVSDGIIVCGDFNDVPNSYTYHKMRGNLTDSFAKTGNGAGVTFNEKMFHFRIDFIFHSSNIESYNCTVGDVTYSDHYPVWTYLKLE